MSHPVWVRGLKQAISKVIMRMVCVAPRVGAWIETCIIRIFNPPDLSHPVWVRGLKLTRFSSNTSLYWVAPRVGAWIETLLFFRKYVFGQVAPRVGAWIETIHSLTMRSPSWSHPVWVRGLKHDIYHGFDQNIRSRTPCGCVD